MRFSGEFINTIDAKWRASIPKELRDVLAAAGEDGLVLTRNMEHGLTAYPPSEWTALVRRIEEHSNATERTRMNRLYIAPSTAVKFDAQGRIPISKTLRMWAGLRDEERELVIVGNFSRIDLFSQARHAEVIGAATAGLQQNAALVAELDLP